MLFRSFLNRLTSVQAPSYAPFAINAVGLPTGSWPNYMCPAPDRAAEGLESGLMKAFLDWAGLRPMTELEFEKACRGPKSTVPNEYIWGDVELVAQTGHSGTNGSGTETATPTNANCNISNIGSVRAGIYATATSDRRRAGGGYYGVMALGGNVFEMVIPTGSAGGRNFAGTHGDGDIDFLPTDWQSVGQRGGGYKDGSTPRVRTSDRSYANYYFWVIAYYTYFDSDGGRGVRTAP